MCLERQAGFSIVAAIFLLVVLALLGVFIASVTGMQQSSGQLDVTGVRAYQSARAGMEWGTWQVLDPNNRLTGWSGPQARVCTVITDRIGDYSQARAGRVWEHEMAMNTTRTTLREALWRWGIPGRKRGLSAVINMAARVQRSSHFSRAPLAGAARIVFGATLLFAASGASAVNYFSSATGNWGVNTTWNITSCGSAGGSGPPGAGDSVTICNTHTVTVAANTTVTNVTVASGGTLSVGGFN